MWYYIKANVYTRPVNHAACIQSYNSVTTFNCHL